MSRPTRTETQLALKAWERNEAQRPHIDRLVAAARLYAGLAPDTCPMQKEYDSIGKLLSHPGNCPVCGGRGYVWPDTLIGLVSEFGQPEWDEVDAFEWAKRLLDVLWEVGND